MCGTPRPAVAACAAVGGRGAPDDETAVAAALAAAAATAAAAAEGVVALGARDDALGARGGASDGGAGGHGAPGADGRDPCACLPAAQRPAECGARTDPLQTPSWRAQCWHCAGAALGRCKHGARAPFTSALGDLAGERPAPAVLAVRVRAPARPLREHHTRGRAASLPGRVRRVDGGTPSRHARAAVAARWARRD